MVQFPWSELANMEPGLLATLEERQSWRDPVQVHQLLMMVPLNTDLDRQLVFRSPFWIPCVRLWSLTRLIVLG